MKAALKLALRIRERGERESVEALANVVCHMAIYRHWLSSQRLRVLVPSISTPINLKAAVVRSVPLVL